LLEFVLLSPRDSVSHSILNTVALEQGSSFGMRMFLAGVGLLTLLVVVVVVVVVVIERVMEEMV
jgi:hypothetical protein